MVGWAAVDHLAVSARIGWGKGRRFEDAGADMIE